jgi:hypothetical protein
MTMVPIAKWESRGFQEAASFINIPQTYRHLQVRVFTRGTGAPAQDLSYLRFNGDFGTTYNSHWMNGNGASTATGFSNGNGFMYLGDNTTSNGGTLANVYANQIIDIYDYANTTKFKTVKMIYGFDANGSGNTGLVSGTWRSTAAITQMSGFSAANSAAEFGSIVTVYGVTG